VASEVRVEDRPEAVEAFLRERGFTDGLPVVPPTPERVEAMLAGSGRPRDHSVGDCPPLNAPATLEKIAINAVMAGCEPSYLPVLIAAVEAFLDPVMNAHAIQTTTNPVGPMILVNGPIRHQIALNCGAGCFGPGTRANATIGRALRLILMNVGGATPGAVDKAPLGWPGKYNSCCIGENEEESPWEPFHVERGFDAQDSTVTVLPVNGMWPITDLSPEKEMVLHHVTHGMILTGPCGGQIAPDGFESVLVMSPVIAKMVAELMPTKKALRDHLYEHARVPLRHYPSYRHEGTLARLAERGIAITDEQIPICLEREKFIILVAGGLGGLQSVGLSCMLGVATTRPVVLPGS
jgi:hypothetical protein